MPKTVSVGRLDLDYFKVVVINLGLGQILDNAVHRTVGVGWLDLD